jgi:hypothetical protein
MGGSAAGAMGCAALNRISEMAMVIVYRGNVPLAERSMQGL